MNDNKISKKQKKLQERKEWREYISIQDENVFNVRKYGVELIEKDEVFVQVNNTRNYWISNYGRIINNLRGKIFYHKTTTENKYGIHFTLTGYDARGERTKIDKFLDRITAEHFLIKPTGCETIWHIDKDVNNNYYKNLVYVDGSERYALENDIITICDLPRKQEYITYTTITGSTAYDIWHGIYNRCYKTEQSSSGVCYESASMGDKWLNDIDLFVEWYMANYYECDGESMAVDKDLLRPGNKVYSPETCCIIPQTLNTMLSNCKKRTNHSMWRTSKENLPLGVRHNKSMEKYYSQIKPCGYDETITLSYWDTPEEAFEEYKKIKQADILLMAAKYKSKVPKNVYDALLKYEVKPY